MYLLSKMVTSPPAILFDWRVNLAEDAGMGGIIELFFRLSVNNFQTMWATKRKKPLTFHYTGCLIGILLIQWFYFHIYILPYKPYNNQVFVDHLNLSPVLGLCFSRLAAARRVFFPASFLSNFARDLHLLERNEPTLVGGFNLFEKY